MGLEVFGFIKDLIQTNPLGTDGKNQGDDHIRGIKETLLNQFPGFTEGIGVTATESELNAVAANTARLEGPLDGRLYAQRDAAWYAIDFFEENAVQTVDPTLDQYIRCYTGAAGTTVTVTEGAADGRVLVIGSWTGVGEQITIEPGVGEEFLHKDGTGAFNLLYGYSAHFLKVDATNYRVTF